MSVEETVKQLILSAPVVVFSKASCPFCVRCLQLLRSLVQGDKISVVDVGRHPDGYQMQQVLRGITGASTVPRVFVGGKSVGGCDETMRAERTGQLRGLLEQAGAV